MSYIDIGLIAFVVLFGALGVWKGVQKSSLALGAFIVSFIIAFFLANVVAEALLGSDSIREFVIGTTGDWSLFKMIDSGMGDTPWLGNSFIAKNFYKPIYDIVKTNKDIIANGTYHEGVALSAAFSLFSAIVGVGLFIVVRALLCIVTMIVKSYIPKKKTVGNRVAGLFVGIARGGVWAFVISIIFSTMGGFGFLSAFDGIEKNYESAVMANHLYEGAYGIKNGLFIPGKDMFARLVFKSGLNKFKPYEPGDPEDPDAPETDPLAEKRYELYVSIMNLNYPSGSRFTYNKTTGQIEEDEDVISWDTSAYKAAGFDIVVDAIISYNNRIGTSIIRANNGTLSTADAVTLEEYRGIYGEIWSVMYGVEGLLGSLGNYMRIINDENFGNHLDQGVVDVLNRELKEYYDAITNAIDKLKEEYAKFTLFTADGNVGNLTIEYPEVVQDKVKGEDEEDDGNDEEQGEEEEEEKDEEEQEQEEQGQEEQGQEQMLVE